MLRKGMTKMKKQKNEWTVKSKNRRFIINRSSKIGLQITDLKPPKVPNGLEDITDGTLFIEPKHVQSFLDTMLAAIEHNQPTRKFLLCSPAHLFRE
jgi:hypothetical protein